MIETEIELEAVSPADDDVGAVSPVPDRLGYGGGVTGAAQAWAVARMELRRGISWRSLWIIVMAFAPVVIIAAHAIGEHTHPLEDETVILNGIVQIYYVRCGIFFGCLGLFLRLVGGRSRNGRCTTCSSRPCAVKRSSSGKFVAGVLTTVLVFGTGVTALHAPDVRTLRRGAGATWPTVPARPICASTSWSSSWPAWAMARVFLAFSLLSRTRPCPR